MDAMGQPIYDFGEDGHSFPIRLALEKDIICPAAPPKKTKTEENRKEEKREDSKSGAQPMDVDMEESKPSGSGEAQGEPSAPGRPERRDSAKRQSEETPAKEMRDVKKELKEQELLMALMLSSSTNHVSYVTQKIMAASTARTSINVVCRDCSISFLRSRTTWITRGRSHQVPQGKVHRHHREAKRARTSPPKPYRVTRRVKALTNMSPARGRGKLTSDLRGDRGGADGGNRKE